MFDRGERKTYFRSQLKGLRLRKLAECADFELSERENECKREKSSSFKMEIPTVSDSFATDVFGRRSKLKIRLNKKLFK